MLRHRTKAFSDKKAKARFWFELVAKILCITFNAFLLFFGVVSLIISTWRLYTHDLVDGALALFLNILFAMLMVAISLYGCRALGGPSVNKHLKYSAFAILLLIVDSVLLAYYVEYASAFGNIVKNGANAYDDPFDGNENDLLDSYRESFYSSWNKGNCTGGECVNAGCAGNPIPFFPVYCVSDVAFGEAVTNSGLEFDGTSSYLLECVNAQHRTPQQIVGIVNSYCYSRDSWAADQKVDAKVSVIITSIFVGFLCFVLLSIIVFVTRPRTWQDEDVPIVQDVEMEVSPLVLEQCSAAAPSKPVTLDL
ncbi:hypothetical protein FOL47_007661 [Perkinsus chesapeaki]|uniref:Uncharacterized protein n=1 Tax=Perkinsus chesapeaki TaxID=330153 RepID=A0A7J6MVF6_PERCH|nr:hypothetical protein FOL47_007661 [Perkinsus chesapeaki]